MFLPGMVKLACLVFLGIIKAIRSTANSNGCNADLSGKNGTLVSPNYPRNYPSNTVCSWQITVPSSMVILFEFEDFDIESGDDGKCSYDKLAIQERKGTKFKTLATFCGTAIPNTFTTTTRLAKVTFSSDESENRKGFKLKWLAKFPASGCGISLYNSSSGSLKSPSYPGSYPNNLNCSYTLIIPDGHRLILTIPFIDIEYDSSCQYDALEIRDNSRVIGRYCGNKEPKESIKINGPKVFIKFTSDDSTVGNGFNITWTSEALHNANDNRKCGRKFHTSRIVGGVFANRGEFPWQAAFFWRTGIAAGKFFCGGALIEENWVLTAAHCFVNGRDPTLYKIVLGEHNTATIEGHEQEFNISRIIVHRGYNMITHDNDIALAQLATNASLNDYVNTLCLPSYAVNPGIRCQIAGWGATVEHGRASNVLMKAEVPIINRTICSREDVYGSKITGNMMCAGFAAGGVDTCQGDSGGPLVCRHSKDPLRWELQGIASWGRGCGRQLRYGVYTVASNYLSWVKGVIGDSRNESIANSTLFPVQTASSKSSTASNNQDSSSKYSISRETMLYTTASKSFGEANQSVSQTDSRVDFTYFVSWSHTTQGQNLTSTRSVMSSTPSNGLQATSLTGSSVSSLVYTNSVSKTSSKASSLGGTSNHTITPHTGTFLAGRTSRATERLERLSVTKTQTTNATVREPKTARPPTTRTSPAISSHSTLPEGSHFYLNSLAASLRNSFATESRTITDTNTVSLVETSTGYSKAINATLTGKMPSTKALAATFRSSLTEESPIATAKQLVATSLSENMKFTKFEDKTLRRTGSSRYLNNATDLDISVTPTTTWISSFPLATLFPSNVNDTTAVTLLPILTESLVNQALSSSSINLVSKSSRNIATSKTSRNSTSSSRRTNEIDSFALLLFLGVHYFVSQLVLRP